MIGSHHPERPRGGRMRIPRSRGAASGFLLILLGLWGALVPFIGPSFDFAFSPETAWTTGRAWLEVLPGVVTVIGGILLLTSRNRATAMLGGWLSVAAGAWFVIGRAMAGPLNLGDAGTPVAASETKRVWLELTYFYGLGALIVFLGALAVGRLSVRSVRDIEYAQRPVTAAATTGAMDAPASQHIPLADQRTEVVGPTYENRPRRGLLGRLRPGRRGDNLVHR
ncbi:hypothetical protein JRC04_04045 [Mycolicibacterium sp. S2-37]|uniref:hypothetical protein n=1 Tax=Mycolicibacterium sp. S2-37 TaxID=2810297 RepID=UPI001A9536AE|nr:hypothetical protein [Mycolicibacterium sp. S2-37]MBO0676634.1 hypothetical protein [Mycolicibacterium sp. S2-37]